MRDTLDWLCYELKVSPDEVKCSRIYKELADKRRTIIAFYHLLDKSTVWIGWKLARNHASICHSIKTMPVNNFNQAVFLLKKFKNGETEIEPITRKIIKKIPDYKHSCVVFKEFIEEIDPYLQVSKLSEVRDESL